MQSRRSERHPNFFSDCRHYDSQQHRDDAKRQQGRSNNCACEGVGYFVELHDYSEPNADKIQALPVYSTSHHCPADSAFNPPTVSVNAPVDPTVRVTLKRAPENAPVEESVTVRFAVSGDCQ